MEIIANGIVKNITNMTFGQSASVEFLLHVPEYGDYKAKCEQYFPIREDDIITGKAIFYQEERFLHFKELPFVQIPTDKNQIKKCFIIAMYGTGFGEISAEKLYNILLEIGKMLAKNQSREDITNENMVILAMNDLSFKWNKSREPQLLELIVSKAKLGELNLDPIQITKLFIWWYDKRSMRRLYLIGLTKAEIANCLDILKAEVVLKKKCYGLDELYNICITNPYTLAALPIEKASQLSKMFNIPVTDENTECGVIIRYIFEKSKKNAWTCTPQWIISKRHPKFNIWRDTLIEKYFVYNEYNNYYLSYQYLVEKEMSLYISNLINKNVEEDANKALENLPTVDTLKMESAIYTRSTLSEEQKIAIQGALQHHISIITGGAGVGKSTIIKEIINNLKLRKIDYVCCSFTGKAVARLKEVTGELSGHYTLDRMIANSSNMPKFSHVIIDETSMVTSELLYRFVKKFCDRYRITFVGDKDQLPPVSWGTLFSALIESGKIPIYTLYTNHRIESHSGQSNDLYILNNANSLINPLRDLTNSFEFENGSGFHVLPSDISIISTIILELFKANIPLKDITCITPFTTTANEINVLFQTIYLADSQKTQFNNRTWHIGDRVLMTYNNYDINVMNGDIGIITKLNSVGVTVKFETITQEYEFKWSGNKYRKKFGDAIEDEEREEAELVVDDLLHCFALTIHKSQGSEYKYVIIYFPDVKPTDFLCVNMIYTAITRTKHTCWVVCSDYMINHLASTKLAYRFDNLSRRLIEINQSITQYQSIKYEDINPFDIEEEVYPDDE